MPRRYLPHGQVLTKTGHPIPVLERFCRDLLLVPEWVLAAEGRTLGAALAATALIMAPVEAAALYQVSYYARIVGAATVSSSLTITIRWTALEQVTDPVTGIVTEEEIAQTYTAPAITGNTTDTQQSQSGILIQAAPDTEVTVETSYSSVGAEDMKYDMVVSQEPVFPTPRPRQREAA